MRIIAILGWTIAAGLAAILWLQKPVVNPPTAKLNYAQLAQTNHEKGDLALAEAMYRMARLEDSANADLDAKLGYLLYEMERDKEAAKILESAKRRGAKVDWLDFTLQNIDARVEMQGPFPRFLPKEEEKPTKPAEKPIAPAIESRNLDTLPEGCTIPLERSSESSASLIELLINGETSTMILDTGATLTVLSGDLATVLNLDTRTLDPIIAKTANGKTQFSTALLNEVRFGDRVISDLRVAICDVCGTDLYDGLLGLDVQRQLGMVVWPEEDKVVFSDCL